MLLVAIGGATGYIVGTRQAESRTQTATQTAVETTIQTTTLVSLKNYTITTSATNLSEVWTSAGGETSSFLSENGLELVISISAPNYRVGLGLNITTYVVNTFPVVNTVLPSHDWLFKGVPVYLWQPCLGGAGNQSLGLPLQIAVLNGNYTAGALPVIANTTVHSNPVCMEGTAVDRVTFLPDSDQANLSTTGWNGVNSSEISGFRFSFITTGYWNLKAFVGETNPPVLGPDMYASPPTAPNPTTFVPGTYTVAVEDEWGQTAVLHFTVQSGA